MNLKLTFLIICTFQVLTINAQEYIANWVLISATYDNSPMTEASGYLNFKNSTDYVASFKYGNNSGYASAHYTMPDSVFQTSIDGRNLVINGFSMVSGSNGYMTSISSSSTAFSKYIGPAIGYGKPIVTVDGKTMTMSSSNGRSKYYYVVEKYNAEAAFSATPTSGIISFAVQFNDESMGEITNREWDFGDGNTSTETNPAHTYSTPGRYNVKLTVSNEYVTNTEEKTEFINALDQDGVEAQFTNTFHIPLTVILSDQSIGTVTNWDWNFDDGASSNEQNPEHTYEYPGEYNLKLKISNSTNADSITQKIKLGSLWKYETGGDVVSSPVIARNGSVYIGSNDKNFYSFNPDGTLKWKLETEGIIESSPAIGSDGTIYVGTSIYEKNMYAINPDSSIKWKYQAEGSIYSSPALGKDGSIYFGCSDDCLYALNSDGSLKWKYETGSDIPGSPAVGTDGVIYIGSKDKNLYAINSDGTLKWKYLTGGVFYSSPSIGNDGTIYATSYDKYLHAINPDGTRKWRYYAGSYIYSSPSVGADGSVYFGCHNQYLYSINNDGTLKWNFRTEDDIYSSPAIGTDGTIYVGSYDYSLYAINPDGTIKWKYETGYKIESSPIIGNDGKLYIGSNDNKVYAFNTKGNGLFDSSWPCFRGNELHTGYEDITVNAKNLTFDANLNFFPNPTQGTVNIKGLPHNKQVQISVFKLSGQMVTTIQHKGSIATINLESEVPGFYLVKISGAVQKSFKIIKK